MDLANKVKEGKKAKRALKVSCKTPTCEQATIGERRGRKRRSNEEADAPESRAKVLQTSQADVAMGDAASEP